MPRTYLDFDLEIERSGTGYRARVLDSPSGSASVDFTLPFSDLEMENFLLKVAQSLGDARRNLRGLDTPDRRLVKTFGVKLTDAVFAGGVKDTFLGSLKEAYGKDAGLRLRLRLTHAPELTNIPWEYLRDPVAGQPLNLNPDTPVVRYLELPIPRKPLTVTPPLRVLVMISSPTDFPRLDVDAEWARLEAALGELIERKVVTLTRLPGATLDTFTEPLQVSQYHVFHFIGHGGFDDQAQDGALVLEDDARRGHLVSGQDLAVMFAGHRSLRLAILNSCEGARGSASDPFAGVAQTLIQQAIPAVVAMQFEITDKAAITFAQAFYGAMSNGYPVDAAVAEGRRSIYAKGNQVEWGTPVLYMQSPNGRLFRMPRPVPPPPEPVLPPLEDDDREEHERLERERLEREERERLEREERERLEREERERLEREEAERERRRRAELRTRVACLVLAAVLLVGAFGAWGPKGKNDGFHRIALLLISQIDAPPRVLWFTSVGLLLVVVAAGVVWAAWRGRRVALGALGGATVVGSLLFIFNFYARAEANPNEYPDVVANGLIASVGWGTWVVIAAGLGIVIVSIVGRFARKPMTLPAPPAGDPPV